MSLEEVYSELERTRRRLSQLETIDSGGGGGGGFGFDRTISVPITIDADACVVVDLYATIEAGGALTISAGAELLILGDTPNTAWRVTVTGSDYSPDYGDRVIVVTATGKTVSLPAAIGSATTYRISYRPASGSLVIDASGSDTVKGLASQTLYAGEDLIITDTVAGYWE